jgi:uncharacterized protein YjbI with pentapeptide repeats
VLQLLVVPLVLLALGYSLTSAQQSAQQLKAAQVQQVLEEQRAQDAALQAYLDVMKGLLVDEDLRHSGPESSVRAVATAQTSLTLERVDGPRKGAVLRLLADSRLIDADAALIDLAGEDLSGASLSEADLSATDLSGANLSNAYLSATNLSGADLSDANLSDANLSGALLQDANLRGADLSGASGITTEELEQQADSLEGATMPDGSKHP